MATVKTFAAGRLLDMGGGRVREPVYHQLGDPRDPDAHGQLVPEAHTVLRLHTLVYSGYLDEVEVEEDEFRAAIAEYCPELEQEILTAVGLEPPGSVLAGPQNSPYHPDNPPASTEEMANAHLNPETAPEAAQLSVTPEEPTGNVCPVCGKVLATAQGLKSHLSQVHPG